MLFMRNDSAKTFIRHWLFAEKPKIDVSETSIVTECISNVTQRVTCWGVTANTTVRWETADMMSSYTVTSKDGGKVKELQIHRPDQHDNGFIICTGENVVGNQTLAVRLKIKCKL
jgi:hypothetical protein